jgi:hypothetical protein
MVMTSGTCAVNNTRGMLNQRLEILVAEIWCRHAHGDEGHEGERRQNAYEPPGVRLGFALGFPVEPAGA